MSKQPKIIEHRYQDIVSMQEEAEILRQKAADSLAKAETQLSIRDRELREVETELSNAREERIRAESAVSQANQVILSLNERINEKLNCEPEELNNISGVIEKQNLPLLEKAEKSDIDGDSDKGPLFFAVKNEYLDLVKLLLEKEAKVSVKGEADWSLLHWAV